jgi:flagellar hook-associated protein 1 FlgK
MSNLLASLMTSADALGAYEQVLAVTQNNVANASTPGYVKQTLRLQAKPLDLTWGTLGGVKPGEVQSARNEYAERAVRRQTVLQGSAQQSVSSLQALNSLFDVTGKSGISSALNKLFQSFSAWGQSPTDTNAKQSVIDRASDLADTFHQAAMGLAGLREDTEQQLSNSVDHLNELVGQLQGLNRQIMAGERNNSGIDAQAYSVIEEMSQYADFTVTRQGDDSFAVLLNGQTPLLLEDRQYELRYSLVQPADPPPTYSLGPWSARIYAYDGTDVTGSTTEGQLGALLRFHNSVLPSYLGDAYHPGDLNVMAQQFAGRVNAILTSGHISDGNPPDDPPDFGSALFQYDTANLTNAASSLRVDPAVTPDQLGSIDPGPPYVFNGTPLALSALAAPRQDADRVNGASYAAFYGSLAARAGSYLSDAQDELETRQSTVAQAKDLRQQMSGVSLDEEAMVMIQFQRAYEANSRLISVLNQLTQAMINILQP